MAINKDSAVENARTDLAKRLKIGRSTLYRKMQEYGLEPRNVVERLGKLLASVVKNVFHFWDTVAQVDRKSGAVLAP